MRLHCYLVISLMMVSAVSIGCTEPQSPQQSAGDWIGIEIPASARVVESINTYSSTALPIPGGLSDGYWHIAFEFTENEHRIFLDHITENMAGASEIKWNSMPIPEDLSRIKNLIEATRLRPNPIEAQHGFYLLIDRDRAHSFYDWSRRSSMNITFAIYDDKERKLYVFLEDT